MDETDTWCGQGGDRAREGRGRGEDVGVEDPDDVVLCFAISSAEVIDLCVRSDRCRACAVIVKFRFVTGEGRVTDPSVASHRHGGIST